jgi:phosphoribosylformimino-5-aminoimidazole carboxamide ribonucleotide (ProFAR) isomerase
VERLLREFGSQLAVSLDVRADRLVTDGWTVDTGEGLSDAARRLVNAGVSRLIHTEVKRDGILAGPGLAGLKQLTSLGVPVMVAGGVSSYQDLKELRAAGAEAASAGRALLHGILTLPAAIVAAGGVAPASVGA